MPEQTNVHITTMYDADTLELLNQCPAPMEGDPIRIIFHSTTDSRDKLVMTAEHPTDISQIWQNFDGVECPLILVEKYIPPPMSLAASHRLVWVIKETLGHKSTYMELSCDGRRIEMPQLNRTYVRFDPETDYGKHS